KRRSPDQAKQKIWLIVDELHAMQKLEFLEESLAELRKYGGAIVLATQNVSQLDKIYGHHGTRIILDQCGTKVSFRQSDSEIAKRMSSFFGQREFRETQEGLSYGAHEMRDGVNLSSVERTRSTISPTQIMNLPDLEAFIKLPGKWPVIRSKFKYFKQKSITDSYVEGEESKSDLFIGDNFISIP
ncbi:MAG: type IV secretion system DNA-binding domain-containing protein, partial [Chlamydiia bacterium]|nr:type IV secretion system DNA-binding domain-containing protein [Chlamydiia bacterium]